MLSRPILTYSAPSAPLAGTSRPHRLAAYTRCLRCAHFHMPRQPTTGSVLSLVILLDMSPTYATESSSAASTRSSLTILAFAQYGRLGTLFVTHTPILVGERFSRSFPVRFRCNLSICLPSCSELTRFASGQRGRLLPAFRRLGHPHRCRISLQCQLGNLHSRDFHPLDHQLASLH